MRPAQIAREIAMPGCQLRGATAASMRPAQIAREIREEREMSKRKSKASMRPAQIAREIARASRAKGGMKSRFNEARANCAGN